MHSYFSNLFTSSRPRDFGEALLGVEPLVTAEMNCQLIFPVSDKEIRAAVFQLGELKSPGSDGFLGFFIKLIGQKLEVVFVRR